VGDVETMATGAIEILSNASRQQAMAIAARKTAQDKFCTSRIIPMYERYYEQILGG